MSRKEYGLVLVLAVSAGLIGGVMSSRFFMDRLMIAQQTLRRAEDIITQMPPQAEVISAKKFQVVNMYGEKVAELGTDDSGIERLLFSGPDGSETKLSLTGMMFRDKTGKSVGTFSPSNLVVGVQDQKGNPITITGGGLVISGSGGNTILLLMGQDGPSLQFADEDGKVRVTLGRGTLVYPKTGMEEKRPISSLVLSDKDGKTIWQAP